MIWLFLLACGAASDDTAAFDTGWCAEQPEVTWESFGEGFLRTECQTCHAADALDRYGAPEGISFDTQEDALHLATPILHSVLTNQTMPPAGGLDELDVMQLEAWLTCTPW